MSLFNHAELIFFTLYKILSKEKKEEAAKEKGKAQDTSMNGIEQTNKKGNEKGFKIHIHTRTHAQTLVSEIEHT